MILEAKHLLLLLFLQNENVDLSFDRDTFTLTKYTAIRDVSCILLLITAM